MLQIITLIILVLGNEAAHAQRPWKEYLVPGTAMLFAGFLEGADEALVYHYDNGFKKALPNANDKFWNPAISNTNQYKNNDATQGEAFFGSTTLLAPFTDGHRLLQVTRVAMDLTAITYCVNKQHTKQGKTQFINWKTVLQDFVVLSAVRTIGFHLAYDGVFKADPNYQAK